MQQSTEIDKLAGALAKAQGEFVDPAKDQTAKIRMKNGGEYSYKYAGLPSVAQEVRRVFSKHGLSFTQNLVYLEGGWNLTTTVLHESGQFTQGIVPLFLPQEMDMKAIASVITYARRYGLLNASGLAPDDDDDAGYPHDQAGGSKKPTSSEVKQSKAATSAAKPAGTPDKQANSGPAEQAFRSSPPPEGVATTPPTAGAGTPKIWGESVKKEIRDEVQRRGIAAVRMKDFITANFGDGAYLDALTLAQAQRTLEWVKNQPGQDIFKDMGQLPV